MASPPPPHTPSNTPDYWYMVFGIAAIAAVLLASNAIAFACCSRTHLVQTLRRFFRWRGVIANGIDDRSLQLIPAWKYSKEQQGSDAECSVCLSVFVDGEDVRQMPECTHLFHAACIDMWLYSHSDCPLCRAKVLPPPPCCPTAGGRGESRRHQMETATMASAAIVLL